MLHGRLAFWVGKCVAQTASPATPSKSEPWGAGFMEDSVRVLLRESQGQIMALTVSSVPCSLDRTSEEGTP